jgi:L-threonine kinase
VIKRSVPIVGYGKSFASFGEVVQGRTSTGEDFLVTLPTDLWSTCELICSPINGPLVVECDLEKSGAVLSHMLAELGVDRGYHFQSNFKSNIPVGKGLSSSTADMLATLRAVQEIFGVLLSDQFISKLFSEIEPHDALHFNSSVIYNHREGRLVENLGYVPNFTIVAVDDGGLIDTLTYNKQLSFSPGTTRRFDALLAALCEAYRARDDVEIARCASESAQIHVERLGGELLRKVLEISDSLGALGVLATHSGTCAGLLFEQNIDMKQLQQAGDHLRETLGREVFFTRTLHLLEAS